VGIRTAQGKEGVATPANAPRSVFREYPGRIREYRTVMSKFLKAALRANRSRLETYAHRDPGHTDLSLIAGPFVWEEELARALERIDGDMLRGYACPHQDDELLQVLADREGLVPEAIWLTPGADLAVEAALGQFLDAGDRLGILDPNFPRFDIVAAGVQGLEVVPCSDLDDLPSDLKMAVVCTPNNPSTEEIPAADLRRAVAARPDTLFCVDGVFDWYGSWPLADLCRDHDNVIVLKSFSKIGLAGLRLGWAMGSPELVADLQRGLTPFAVPALVQAVGLEVARRLDRVEEIKDRLETEFGRLHATLGDAATRRSPVPFYLLATRQDVDDAAARLAARGISVVDGAHFRGLPSHRLRVAIGSAAENDTLLATLDELELLA